MSRTPGCAEPLQANPRLKGATPQRETTPNSGVQPKRFHTQRGKIRIEGTSNLDDWQVESTSLVASLEVPPDFPLESGSSGALANVIATAYAAIDVKTLKSVEKDGKPFSNKMDEIMYEKLKTSQHPRITYRLISLSLRVLPETVDAPYQFESKGELVVGGCTNRVIVPINLLPLSNQRLKITGETLIKMTDFHIDPPSPKIALGLIKTGNQVKLILDALLTIREVHPPHD